MVVDQAELEVLNLEALAFPQGTECLVPTFSKPFC